MKIVCYLIVLISFSCRVYAQCEVSEQKLFKSPTTFFDIPELTFTNNNTAIIGANAYQPTYSCSVAAMDVTNNTISWLKNYQGFYLKNIKIAANNDIIVAGLMYGEVPSKTLVIARLDVNGNPKWVKKYKDNFSPDNWIYNQVLPHDLLPTSDDGIVICGGKQYQYPASNNYRYRSFVFKVDRDGNLVWTREDTNNSHDEYFSAVEKNGFVYIAGTTSIGSVNYAAISKLNLNTGALVSVSGYQLQNIGANYIRKLFSTSYGFIASMEAYSSGVAKTGYYVLMMDNAGNVIRQKQLSFNGSALFNPYYEIRPTADNGCLVWLNDKDNTLFLSDANLYKLDNNLQPQWKKNYPVPATYADAIIYNAWDQGSGFKALGLSVDPKENLKNKYPRLFNIKQDGTLNGCVTRDATLDIKDSLQYNLTPISWTNTYQLAIETPTALPASAVSLTVTEELICNNACSMNDFNIQGDTVLCSSNETILTAKRNGNCTLDFKWNTANLSTDITAVNDSTVKIKVLSDGFQKLTVTWSGNCKSITKDVILYRNLTDVKPNLGVDTSLCRGDSVLLEVQPGWKSVLWSDNTMLNKLTVRDKGTYSVKVTNDNICFLKDTLNVIDVYDNPVINIHNTAWLCKPGVLELAPGIFNSYLWQDNSTAATFNVSTTGKYWVTVTNEHLCKGSDTVVIKNEYQSPVYFVSFKDSSICYGQQIILDVKNDFISYDWENGESVNKQFLVNVPGIYPVKVIDENGCTGFDTVLLRDKRCELAVYFPNAFSPTGKNKSFKALFTGAIPSFYQLSIYNKWGEKIFESRDPYVSWDGTYKGNEQFSGIYIWQCRYRFFNEAIKNEKGTVMLIK